MATSATQYRATVSAVSPARKKWERGSNIALPVMGEFVWNHNDLVGSLDALSKYVENAATQSEGWYWARKRTKALLATIIQWTAILLTGVAGLWPIIVTLKVFPGFRHWLSGYVGTPDPGLLASLFIGAGAAFLGIDRVAGISSGWTRYVLTATAIRAATEEFRLDWAALNAQFSSAPQPEQVAAMIQRAKVFRMAIEALIQKETQDWATEFRQNLNSLEQQLNVQVNQAKAARDKADQDAKAQAAQAKAEKEKAEQPGAIELSVPNASSTDGFSFQIKLEDKDKPTVEDTANGSETWTRINLSAGQYKLTISALVNKQTVSSTIVVVVNPGETAKCEASFPQAKGAATLTSAASQ